jgi:hypothetical protein
LSNGAGLADWDVYRLQRAVNLKWLAVVLSFLDLEETLLWSSLNQQKLERGVSLILEISDHKLFARGQDEIIHDDIRSYAYREPFVSPFCPCEPFVELVIRNLVNPTEKGLSELHDIIGETIRTPLNFVPEICGLTVGLIG